MAMKGPMRLRQDIPEEPKKVNSISDDINSLFNHQQEKSAELEAKPVEKPAEPVKQEGRGEPEEKKTEKTEEIKNTTKPKDTKKNKPAPLFDNGPKKKFQQKCVYLSTKNIDFIKEQAELSEMNFSEVLELIIDNFRENL